MPSLRSTYTVCIGMEPELTLEELGFQLAEANTLNQTTEDLRKDLKNQFFSLIDEEVANERATKTISIPDGYTASEFVSKYYGDWEIHHQDKEDPSRVVLIEKASIRPFEIVVQGFDEDGNPLVVEDRKGKEALGYVVSRNIRTATPIIDYKRIKEEDPELYLRTTDDPKTPPYVVEVLDWVSGVQFGPGTEKAALHSIELESMWLDENPQPRPIKEDISVKDLAKLQKNYLIRPASTVVLNVRLAKEDEV